MRQPAAKQGDQIVATDTHFAMFPAPSGEVAAPVPHPFNGIIRANVSGNVNIMGAPAATAKSVASDDTHLRIPPGASRFQKPPANEGQVNEHSGSSTVFINQQRAVRHGDAADTCNDLSEPPLGKVVASGTVLIG